MKNLIALCFCFWYCFLQAQSPLGFKHEIGLRLLSIPETWVTQTEYWGELSFPQTEYANHLTYQRFWGNFGARLGLTVHVEKGKIESCEFCGESYFSRNRFVPKIGLIYKLRFRRFMPYVALDIFKTKELSHTILIGGDYNSETEVTEKSLIFNAIFGVDYKFFRQFSVGIEIWEVLNLVKIKGYHNEYSGWSLQYTYTQIDEREIRTLYSPLAAIWGKFHF